MPGHAGEEPPESVLNDMMAFLKVFPSLFSSTGLLYRDTASDAVPATTLMGRYGSTARCTTVVLRMACESVEMNKLRLLACCEGNEK